MTYLKTNYDDQIFNPYEKNAIMMTRILPISFISLKQRDRMFDLMSQYYVNIDRSQFDSDLNEKTQVILLLDKGSQIQGFSTILKKFLNLNGKEVIALFSGDTVLDKAYWGNGALGLAFGRYLTQVKFKNLMTPTYWFLITKGYKTYLLMANNFPNHYPSPHVESSSEFAQLMDLFYSQKFPDSYDPKRGLIRFQSSSCALKATVADIDAELLKHPRIRFFVDRNPNWQKGEELTCVAEVSLWIPVRYVLKRIRKNLMTLAKPLRKKVNPPLKAESSVLQMQNDSDQRRHMRKIDCAKR